MRLEASPRLFPTMLAVSPTSLLDMRLTEVLMSALAPCDLGDGIEVVHDVEAVEIEMECDVDEDPAVDPPVAAVAPPVETRDLDTTLEYPRDEVVNTTPFTRENVEDLGTRQFVRYSAPYERIELQIDPRAFLRSTIEEAKRAVQVDDVK